MARMVMEYAADYGRLNWFNAVCNMFHLSSSRLAPGLDRGRLESDWPVAACAVQYFGGCFAGWEQMVLPPFLNRTKRRRESALRRLCPTRARHHCMCRTLCGETCLKRSPLKHSILRV